MFLFTIRPVISKQVSLNNVYVEGPLLHISSRPDECCNRAYSLGAYSVRLQSQASDFASLAGLTGVRFAAWGPSV